MTLMVNNLVGFGATTESSGPASITFAASAVSASNVTAGNTYTFSSHSIGTASADRYVVVTVTTNSRVSAVTVGGASCTLANSRTNGGASYIYITDGPVTSGTTASIVVTISTATSAACGIGTFAVTGLQSITPTATATQTTDVTATNLAVTASGVAVGVVYSENDDTYTHSWTNLTERYDARLDAGEAYAHSGASADQATSQTLSITVDAQSTGAPTVAIALAAFR